MAPVLKKAAAARGRASAVPAPERAKKPAPPSGAPRPYSVRRAIATTTWMSWTSWPYSIGNGVRSGYADSAVDEEGRQRRVLLFASFTVINSPYEGHRCRCGSARISRQSERSVRTGTPESRDLQHPSRRGHRRFPGSGAGGRRDPVPAARPRRTAGGRSRNRPIRLSDVAAIVMVER